MIRLLKWWKLLLVYTWFIIVWGAFVRASGSGDGCGKNWPSCHGELFLPNSSVQTLIEYIHRATSGFYGIFVLILVIFTLSILKKERIKRPIYYIIPVVVLFLTIFEALIGAKLVLSGLVGLNASWSRAIIMIVHLLNTFILVSSIVGGIILYGNRTLDFERPQIGKNWYIMCTLLLIAVAALGALTALGDTLYPAESLHHGITQDFALGTPWILRLRVFHPVLAVLTVFAITYMTLDHLKHKDTRLLLIWAYLVLSIGLVNLLLLAPVHMQLLHLLGAQILWSYHSLLGFKKFI